MEKHIFEFSLIKVVATEKVLQFIMPLKSIYNENLGFIAQKNVFLNTTERFKQEKNLSIDIVFCHKKNSEDFSEPLIDLC